jgi:hypothetical protein
LEDITVRVFFETLGIEMSSVQSYIKQQNIIYGALPNGQGTITLNNFTRAPFDPSNPNSTSGNFEDTAIITVNNTATGLTPIFRDMGEVIRSAGRTFRRVQQLTAIPTTFGVGGVPSTGAVENDYRTHWYEVSLIDGVQTIGPLFQIRG